MAASPLSPSSVFTRSPSERLATTSGKAATSSSATGPSAARPLSISRGSSWPCAPSSGRPAAPSSSPPTSRRTPPPTRKSPVA
eukprot:10534588-Alexandrium_andersonii.AAC.1